VDNTLCQTR